jgi:SAM-dependent methyltransferase
VHQDTSEFEEADYLAANPDVAAAVRSGAFSSGADHYARHGRHENRVTKLSERSAPLRLPFPAGVSPSRRDKFLANLDLHSLDGLEIGALASPIVSSSEGSVFYVDHADTETLRTKYANEPSIDVSRIVQVNAVWGENTLRDCIGKDRKVDYVVASHVIEHVPDLITWLSEIRSILRPTGTLRIAVPDRRYTFDYLRFESRLHDVLDAYLKRARAPSPRLIMEHNNLIRHVDCEAAWNGTIDPDALRPHWPTPARIGLEAALNAINHGTYYDTHCWVFTPVSFADLFREIADLDLLGFSCGHFFETSQNEIEFFVHLSPCDDKNKILASWVNMKATLLQSTSYQRTIREGGTTKS